jgi:hypothetical protein
MSGKCENCKLEKYEKEKIMRHEDRGYVEESKTLYNWYDKPVSLRKQALVIGSIILALIVGASILGLN